MKTIIIIAGILQVAALAAAQTVIPGPIVHLPSNAPITLVATATNNFAGLLQRGLFEEEGNRDYHAAISSYEALVAQFDQNRQLAATAVFRLGECYRKLGRTNEAVAQYERIVREFSDQQTLATLSRQNIAGLGIKNATLPSASPTTSSPEALELERCEKILAQLQGWQLSQLRSLIPALVPDAEFDRLNEQLKLNERYGDTPDKQILESRSRTEKHLHDKAEAILETLRNRVNELREVVSKQRNISSATSVSNLEAAPDDEDKEIRRIQKMVQDSPDLISATGQDGMTPLAQAAAAGWLKVAAFLLDHGAALDGSALLYATKFGNKAMVEFLLNRGADVNAKDGTGDTSLHNAAEKGYLSVAQVLVQHGANLEARNSAANGEQRPLHRAATYGRSSIIALLVGKGADVNARDAKGVTPLGRAVLSGQSGAISELLKAGAKTDIQDNEGRTALEYAAAGGNVESVKALLAAKADPNAGKTSALFAAVNPEIIKLLLDAGANPNVKDLNGKTPLLAVIEKGPAESAAVLIEQGADVNAANNSGFTPLQMAVWKQNLPMVSLLLKNGVDINAKDSSGRSALMMSKEAESGYHPSRPGDYGGPSAIPDKPLARKISALLREHGALEDSPK